MQHIKSCLKIHGRAAVVLPDNVLFEGGPGEKVRRKLMHECDLRTNMRFTLKQNRLRAQDLADFVTRYKPGDRQRRRPTWSEKNPDGRWRAYPHDQIVARDKASLDIFWLRDHSLEDSASLPEPPVLAAEIADDLRASLEQIEGILADRRAAPPRHNPRPRRHRAATRERGAQGKPSAASEEVEVAERRVVIYPRRRRIEASVRHTVTLASSSMAIGLVVTPAVEPSDAVSLVTVRRRSEKEAQDAALREMRAAMRAQTEQEYQERHRELDREVEQRADEKVLERYLEHGTLVRPTLVQGDMDPHAPGTPAVTISDFEAMWWGPDEMLVSFVMHNAGETAFEWDEAQVFGPDRRAGHVSAAHVQMPAIPAAGLVGRLPGGKRARGAVLVERPKALAGPMTIVLGETGGGRPLVATVGNWIPLQTEQALPGWEIRPAQPPDLEKGKVSLHLQGVYGAIWLDDGAGLNETDATSLTGLGVRAQYAFNRYIAFEGEAMGASTGEAHFDDVAYEGMQGDLARSASLGRVQLGGVLRLGGDRYVPTARLGVGLQGASLGGTLTTATGDVPGPEAFEFDALWHFGAGMDVRIGDSWVAGFMASGVAISGALESI